jgi:hypothetical protein
MRMRVRLERHEANKTSARTWWTVLYNDKEIPIAKARELNLIQRIRTTATCEKTHWYEEYEVINPLIKFVKHRITNRGNYHRTVYEARDLMVEEEDDEDE